MRQRLTLYIADRKADLSDDSFVLLNFTQDDLANPTIVRNSFSQQITLQGTAANNAIFGDLWRLDRVTDAAAGQTGPGFDPSRKAPFSLYDETGEILVSGYVKLNAITRKQNRPQYKVTLYGGLGSFLYALSYTGDGEKKTLASLDYLGTGNTDTELDFTITAAAVRAAWGTMPDGNIDGLWKVLNFAPAYNGIPDNFAADKFLAVPSDFNLANTQDGHTLSEGYAVFNLPEKADGWKMRDFRSYLQRPILSMRAFLTAIAKPENNGGYSVDWSDIAGLDYTDTWLTLPMLPSLTPSKQNGGLSLSSINSGTGEVSIIGAVPAGVDVTASISARINLTMIDAAAQTYGTLYSSLRSGDAGVQTAIFAQLVAYDAGGNVVAGSPVRSWYDFALAPRDMASAIGYVPEDNAAFIDRESLISWPQQSGALFSGPEASFTITAQYVSYYVVKVTAYRLETQTVGGTESITASEEVSSPRVWANMATEYQGTVTFASGSAPDTITVATSSSIRSGAAITKAMLLSTSATPADYLLSFCKTFGLYIIVDQAEKAVTILRRNALYRNAVKDIDRRIDISQDLDITPVVFSAKWYDFQPEVVEGAFATEYRGLYGIDYGIQRVNTGFDFNADATNLMQGNVLRAAVSRMRRAKWFNTILSGGKYIPSAFLDKGNTYTLWNADGETQEFQVPGPPTTAAVTYDNPTFPGYDTTDRPEFSDAEGKAVDGANVLLFFDGYTTVPYSEISDDVAAMDTLNGGPCWLVSARTSAGILAPHFTRYKVASGVVTSALDFGRPKELGLPGITYPDSVTIYRRCWAAYMADKYSKDTRMVTAKVDLSGIQVGQDILRDFYYFAGVRWVLNAVRYHSMTTHDLTECEFVQVQDMDAYLDGQY